MDMKSQYHELLERTKKFRWNTINIENLINAYKNFYILLCNTKNDIIIHLDKTKELNQKQILETVFNKIFDLTTVQYSNFRCFQKPSILHHNIYEACLFTTLCMFLHNTTRIAGKSLREFVYNNSDRNYNDKNSESFCPPESYSDILLNEESTLRKSRHRLLSNRLVYNPSTEWSAMSKDSEYEWSLYTGLEVMDTRLQDTFKRVKNLYNDIQNVLKDEKYKGNLENVYKAYKRFSSKLQKLKYENYLELQKEILFHHICDNDTYFGINIYRFEKESKLYIMINEIKC